MMDSFFFLPSTKLDKFNRVRGSYNAEIIIDLEDSVVDREKEVGLNFLIENPETYLESWIRINLRSDFNQPIDASQFDRLKQAGYNKFVLPKIKSEREIQELLQTDSINLNIIILIEHPRLFYDLPDFLSSLKRNVFGLGLGTHDLLSFIGANHNPLNTSYARNELLYLARSFGLKAIDTASMNIDSSFKDELENVYDMGFRSKFIVHPKQLEMLSEFNSKTNKKNIERAKEIVEIISNKPIHLRYEPFIHKGVVVERPHIIKSEQILAGNYGK
ncbi:aldolase/citrate lyase family protein [Roseivirga sp.]|uniref:aldolase/citrate lyase family protein n=1 Tax=Roseivirga sp. TaxID=1964215 RepID=UPI003B51C119